MELIIEDKYVTIYCPQYRVAYREGRSKQSYLVPVLGKEVANVIPTRATFIYRDNWYFYLNSVKVGEGTECKYNITCGITGYAVMEAVTDDLGILKFQLRDMLDEGFARYLAKVEEVQAARGQIMSTAILLTLM